MPDRVEANSGGSWARYRPRPPEAPSRRPPSILRNRARRADQLPAIEGGPVPPVPAPRESWRRTRSALRVCFSNRRPYDCRGHHQSGYTPKSVVVSKPRWCATSNGGTRHVHANRRRLRRPRGGRWNRTPRPSAAPGALGLRTSRARLNSKRRGPHISLLLRGLSAVRFISESAPSWPRASAPDRKHVVRYACAYEVLANSVTMP
jgi:hypothetical protein